MGHWNYRIVKYKDGTGYGLHEVYYDDKELAWSMTKHPISFSCDEEEGPDGVIKSVQMACDDAAKRPVFEEPNKWPGKVKSSKDFKLRLNT